MRLVRVGYVRVGRVVGLWKVYVMLYFTIVLLLLVGPENRPQLLPVVSVGS